jgi:hypothetical protein
MEMVRNKSAGTILIWKKKKTDKVRKNGLMDKNRGMKLKDISV